VPAECSRAHSSASVPVGIPNVAQSARGAAGNDKAREIPEKEEGGRFAPKSNIPSSVSPTFSSPKAVSVASQLLADLMWATVFT
jgi:hypothetical protein